MMHGQKNIKLHNCCWLGEKTETINAIRGHNSQSLFIFTSLRMAF